MDGSPEFRCCWKLLTGIALILVAVPSAPAQAPDPVVPDRPLRLADCLAISQQRQPSLVVADLDLLRSLDPREVRSGTAEVIKYGAVCSASLFEQLERGDLERLLALDAAVLTDIVAQCCRLKGAVVEQDEFDKKGIRNVLNFGHTIGHALELSADYRLAHGEAVAIGMVAATEIARALSIVDAEFEERLCTLIRRAGLPLGFANEPGLFERVVRAMQMDKKFREGRNVFVLPTAVGAWEQRENVDWTLVHEAVRTVLEI